MSRKKRTSTTSRQGRVLPWWSVSNLPLSRTYSRAGEQDLHLFAYQSVRLTICLAESSPGGRVWDASIVLASYMLGQYGSCGMEGMSVIEIGAGISHSRALSCTALASTTRFLSLSSLFCRGGLTVAQGLGW